MKHTQFRKTLVIAVVFLLSILVLTPSIFGVTNANYGKNITINVETNEDKIILIPSPEKFNINICSDR